MQATLSPRKTAKEILIEARSLIEDPAHWVQGVFARDVYGFATIPQSNQACKFCARGAIMHAGTPFFEELRQAERVLVLAAQVYGYGSAGSLNDRADHDLVLKMFDWAIKYYD